MISVHTGSKRSVVASLAPYLHRSLELGFIMNPRQMRPEDEATCRWVEFGIGKGVTHPAHRVSVFAVPMELKRGLHADLVAGLGDVDPAPLCYDDVQHIRGFGGFIRWVYFADPRGGPGVLGIDFSVACRPTSGVATSMLTVADTTRVAVAHGIPDDAEVALLNSRMCEATVLTALRHAAGLWTAADWIVRAPETFGPHGERCPRCGCSLPPPARFCARCGCRPSLVRWRRAQDVFAAEAGR